VTTTADQLASLEAEYEGHVWAMRHHTNEARRLLPMVRVLQAAVEREEAAIDRQARKYLGPDVRRSA
jgi:hypothetical protein